MFLLDCDRVHRKPESSLGANFSADIYPGISYILYAAAPGEKAKVTDDGGELVHTVLDAIEYQIS